MRASRPGEMVASRQGKRARRSRDEWRFLLIRFGNDGLGVAAFCRREGISAASFYRWRSVLRSTVDCGDEVVHDSESGFVDLGALKSHSPGSRLDLKLDLGDGLVLHLVRG